MKSSVRTALALALLGAMGAPAVAAAQHADKPVVAVLRFDNNSFGKDAADYNNVGKGISAMLITDLAANPRVVVVDRDRIQQILQEQNLVKQGAVDPATAVRIGKLVGAQYLVTGGFMANGRGTVVLTAHSTNIETGVIGNPQKVQGKSDDVFGLISQLSDKVSKDMKLPPIAAGTVGMTSGNARAGSAGTKVRKMDMRTVMLYSQALDAKDNGDNAKAAELFRQVLHKFPNYTPARQNLAKVTKSGD